MMNENETYLNSTVENETENEHEENIPNESKADKFLRLAPGRVNKILSSIDSLKKLSSRSSYEYTSEQVEKMFTALKGSLEECEKAFEEKKKEDKEMFTF